MVLQPPVSLSRPRRRRRRRRLSLSLFLQVTTKKCQKKYFASHKTDFPIHPPPCVFVPPLQEELPPPPAPAGTYNPVVIIGKTVYVSGIGPLAPDASSHLAKVGAAEDKARSSVTSRHVTSVVCPFSSVSAPTCRHHAHNHHHSSLCFKLSPTSPLP